MTMPVDPATLPRTPIPNFEEVRPRQVALAGSCEGIESIRDFGGMYIVHGKYLLEAAVQSGASFVSMIDLNEFPEFWEKVDETRKAIPDLELEHVQADFREMPLYDTLRPADVSLLYNVLLHQENYVSIIQAVCSKTTKYVCVAQPCLAERHFPFPASATIVQFWPDDLKAQYREGSYWLEEPRDVQFNIAYWIWGHTVSHLIACFYGCGWVLDDGEIIDETVGPHWEYPLLRFRPADGA